MVRYRTFQLRPAQLTRASTTITCSAFKVCGECLQNENCRWCPMSSQDYCQDANGPAECDFFHDTNQRKHARTPRFYSLQTQPLVLYGIHHRKWWKKQKVRRPPRKDTKTANCDTPLTFLNRRIFKTAGETWSPARAACLVAAKTRDDMIQCEQIP